MTLESNEGIFDSPKDRRQSKKRAQKQVRQMPTWAAVSAGMELTSPPYSTTQLTLNDHF